MPAVLAAASALGAVARAAEQPSAGTPQPQILCPDRAGPVALGSAQWNGWGHDVENTRYQSEPALRAADIPKLALKWSFGFPGTSVSAQPSIADGRLFVANAAGRVYALDAKTGCTYWTYDAQAGVRTAISIAELAAARAVRPKKAKRGKTNAHLDVQKPPSAAFFGDDKGAVYALDAERGTLLWKTQIDAQPTARIQAAPTLYKDRLYVAVASSEPESAADPLYACCTFRGSVAALDIATGRVVWRTYTIADEPRAMPPDAAGTPRFGPAGVPVAAAPTIDSNRGAVYVATGAARNAGEQPLADAVIALNLSDGALRWAKPLSSPAHGGAGFDASPILRTLASGKQVILAAQRSGTVYGLDPDHAGDILWQVSAAEEKIPEGVAWGPAADHHSLYVALSGLTAEPPSLTGSVTSLDIRSGGKRWQTRAPAVACSWGGEKCSHAQAQAVTVIPGAAFSGSMDGHFRAYSTIDGKILWDYDTARDFAAVNQVKASGGSLDQGGATIVNGVVYVNSGSAQGLPGNALLAFSVDGK